MHGFGSIYNLCVAIAADLAIEHNSTTITAGFVAFNTNSYTENMATTNNENSSNTHAICTGRVN